MQSATDVEVRTARSSDAERVTALIASLGYVIDAGSLDIVDPSSRVFVAERDGAIVGCLALSIRRQVHLTSPIASIDALITDEHHRSGGIGKALLEVAAQRASDEGAAYLELHSNFVRSRAHRFYEREGFRATSVYFRRDIRPSRADTPIEAVAVPTLDGVLVTLSGLTVEDAEGLFPSASDPEVWRWKLVPRPRTDGEMRDLIQKVMLGFGRQAFTIRCRHDGRPIGSTTLANFDHHHRRVEMDFTWLERAAWGQGFNEDAKYVLLKYCFEQLRLERVEWQVDADNERSWRALERQGFMYEGTLRSRHVRPDGTRRDSKYYGLLRAEWAAAADRLVHLRNTRSGVR